MCFRPQNATPSRLLARLLPVGAVVGFLQLVWFAHGNLFSAPLLLVHIAFVGGVLFIAWFTQPSSTDKMKWRWPWQGVLATLTGVGVGLAYAISGATLLAWISVVFLAAVSLPLGRVFSWRKAWVVRWILLSVLALAFGTLTVSAEQIESRFAEEEFFALLQILELTTLWLLLHLAWKVLPVSSSLAVRKGITIRPLWLGLGLLSLGGLGMILTVLAYQHSFYPESAPTYPGIDAESPFVCGQVPADPQIYQGSDLIHRMSALVQANPYKQTPEYGFLALANQDEQQASEFRARLLEEARQGLFTQPANSVKYGQWEASMRAYFYAQVRTVFPSLFNQEDKQVLGDWFNAIRQRTLKAGWVDGLYALAFTKLPEGPYENQETGSGLLALLEWMAGDYQTMRDNPSQKKALDYLNRNPRGWLARFRNSDDVFYYQTEWIYNAYFQSLIQKETRPANARLSLLWLYLQALPDGFPLRYNHPAQVSLAEIAYFGAGLLKDEHSIWLAGRSLDKLESGNGLLIARPEMETVLDMTGISPTWGSCLMYGNSGLPNQLGPLGPDKIVFRDGWSDDSAYLLLNLRFTGWHRYKATNTAVLFYQHGPLAVENMSGETVSWVPVGRSLFRDKRIPRENLNGLVIERTGLSAVLYALTGAGGPWAQDPPHFARVEYFKTGTQFDSSSSLIESWRDWRHQRRVFFYHRGPVVLLDEANGPAASQAALIWHVPLDGPIPQTEAPWRFTLRQGSYPAEMLLIPIREGKLITQPEELEGMAGIQITYQPMSKGRLSLATIFLTREWVGAQADLMRRDGQIELHISNNGERVIIPVEIGETLP